ncbi:response regulator [Pararhizobium sp.]|uniref:response regulator n=1 Tax=Pararhizobium sp. TaxID=1977563 RepID=UPI0027216DD8|nr:response regulator [Pararhizobium sp.]MDO9416943.1 response regulator [Pararhizobium sp.]
MSLAAKTVLLLEDQPLIALDLEDLLHQAGFENIVTFTRCDDAETWLKGNDPDLAIVDIYLIDGPCEAVAARLAERATPFIVYSGDSKSQLDTGSVFHHGTWVIKPCQPHVLLQAINAVVQQRACGPAVLNSQP